MAIIPASVIDAALEHANTKYKLKNKLSRQLLIRMYWEIRERRSELAALVRKPRSPKVSTSFVAAREWVLDQHFPQRQAQDQFIRKAYSSALGKIGQSFSTQSQPTFRLKNPRRRVEVTLEADRRQYRMLV